ncbi:RNA exonuclease 3 [Malassezia sp. CBS 17886]|nr:RNA exonuclease 3 [Malassezia sp. CBS 17886]
MFRTLGALDEVVCPAHRDGECESSRGMCPFSHDLFKMRLHAETRGVSRPRATDTGAPAAADSAGKKRTRVAGTADSGQGVALQTQREDDVRGALLPPPIPALSRAAHPGTSKISYAQRQGGLHKLHAALVRVYASLLPPTNAALHRLGCDVVARDTLATEAEVFQHASTHTYRTSCVTAAVGVTKRDRAVLADCAQRAADMLAAGRIDAARAALQACKETGSNAEVLAKRAKAQARADGHLTRERIVRAGFVCAKGDLAARGYRTECPAAWGAGGDRPNAVGEKQKCERCGTYFCVAPLGGADAQDREACRSHPGRPRREPTSDARSRKVLRWTCCGRTVDSGALGDDWCTTGPHVFKEDDDRALHAREAFVTLADVADAADGAALDVAALDCEMSYTTAGVVVTRITLVDEAGDVVFDELIRCADGVSVLDFNTQFSGIQPDEYAEKAILDLPAARRILAQYLGPDTVLVGHSLENDLRALRIMHTTVVDTTHLFQHPRGFPYRLALRDLVAKHLGRFIQTGGAAVGHSSLEDAQTTLELVRWKLRSGVAGG